MATMVKLLEEGKQMKDEVFQRRNEADEWSRQEYEAIVRVQAWYRGQRARAYLGYLNDSAVAVQRRWRGFLGRKHYRIKVKNDTFIMRLNHYNSMAVKIQKVWKGYYTRKYVFNYYSRKSYLEGLVVKNEMIRKELEAYKEQQDHVKRMEEEKKALEALEYHARKNHYLLSTVVVPGIYDSPFQPYPDEMEFVLRKVQPLSHKKEKMKEEPFDPTCKKYGVPKPAMLPPLPQKPQGPFRDPTDVQKQRYKPFQPTLRVETDFEAVDKTRGAMKNHEWVTRYNDNLFVPFTTRNRPYDPLLHSTSDYGHLPYGTKYYREEHLDKHVTQQSAVRQKLFRKKFPTINTIPPPFSPLGYEYELLACAESSDMTIPCISALELSAIGSNIKGDSALSSLRSPFSRNSTTHILKDKFKKSKCKPQAPCKHNKQVKCMACLSTSSGTPQKLPSSEVFEDSVDLDGAESDVPLDIEISDNASSQTKLYKHVHPKSLLSKISQSHDNVLAGDELQHNLQKTKHVAKAKSFSKHVKSRSRNSMQTKVKHSKSSGYNPQAYIELHFKKAKERSVMDAQPEICSRHAMRFLKNCDATELKERHSNVGVTEREENPSMMDQESAESLMQLQSDSINDFINHCRTLKKLHESLSSTDDQGCIPIVKSNSSKQTDQNINAPFIMNRNPMSRRLTDVEISNYCNIGSARLDDYVDSGQSLSSEKSKTGQSKNSYPQPEKHQIRLQPVISINSNVVLQSKKDRITFALPNIKTECRCKSNSQYCTKCQNIFCL